MLAIAFALLAIPIGLFLVGYLITALIALGIADSTAITLGLIFWFLFVLLGFVVGFLQDRT